MEVWEILLNKMSYVFSFLTYIWQQVSLPRWQQGSLRNAKHIEEDLVEHFVQNTL